MGKIINIGVIGCGHWGPNFVRDFSQNKLCSVKYICDLNHQRLSRISRLYPHLVATQDYRHLLEDKCIDAVVIATPVATHYRLAKEALLTNKHVLVEKPIALDIREARELADLAKEEK